jgi:predicted DsbA family dithiol-disulfide isomerase
MTPTLRIDVYFDLICPWCLIGKRHLNQALAQLVQRVPGVQVNVAWHSVQLIPEVPAEGLDFAEFYLHRLGSADAVRARQAQVREAAHRAGAVVDFARILRFPNTRQAHQLFSFAASHLAPLETEQLLERLFEAYFNLGEDLSERATLKAIAAQHGLDTPELDAWMACEQWQPVNIQVPGVPFFVFNQSKQLSGAQPVEVLLAAMLQSIGNASEPLSRAA